MSSGSNNSISLLSDFLLKFAVIFYTLPFFYNAAFTSEFESDFWASFFKILLIVLFLGITIINLLLSRSNFYIFGFFLVALGSIYSILNLMFTSFKFTELPIQVLLLVVAIYFLTKDRRKHR